MIACFLRFLRACISNEFNIFSPIHDVKDCSIVKIVKSSSAAATQRDYPKVYAPFEYVFEDILYYITSTIKYLAKK